MRTECMSLITHGDIGWSGEDPICVVAVLRIVPKKGFDTPRYYRLILPGQEGLSIHSFNSLQDEKMVISPPCYHSGGKWRECPYLDNHRLRLRSLFLIDDPIQPRSVPVLTHPPRME